MSKPIILIPLPIQDKDKVRYQMGANYVRSLIRAGAVPVLVPTGLDDDSLRSLYEAAGGLLLTGGADVDPALFGEACHPLTEGIDDDRDHAEISLMRWSVADDKPVLGICRGIQVMNVAMGGSLIQDIPSQIETNLVHAGHWQGAARDQVLHQVACSKTSRLGGILGSEVVGVNSFHHQSLKDVAPVFEVTAIAEDEVVEGVEIAGARFCLGVQWHPEEMSAARPDMQRLFDALVAAAAA